MTGWHKTFADEWQLPPCSLSFNGEGIVVTIYPGKYGAAYVPMFYQVNYKDKFRVRPYAL